MEYIINKYVIFKKYNYCVVGANFLNNAIFSFDVKQYELLDKNRNRLGLLKNNNPVFFSVLLKLGVIITEQNNLYNIFLLKNRIITFNNNSYRLTINPTLNCNCSCWYCYETHTKKIMSPQVVRRVENFIETTVKTIGIKSFYLDWFGGEPLLCYNNKVVPICHYSKNICEKNNVVFESGITTNGYLINKKMIDFFKEVNMTSFQITLDGDRDIHNNVRIHNKKIPTFDKIIENICLLADKLKPKNLALRINYTNDNFDSINSIINYIPFELRSNIIILLQQVWQDEQNKFSVSRVEEKKKIFKKAGFNVKEDILNMKCYSCYADLYNQAVINYDGRVFKCTARNFNDEKEDGVLGNFGQINWDMNRLSSYITNATFENVKCKECIYLPICFGACSKKMALVKDDIKILDKFCFKSGIAETLDYIMDNFSTSNLAVANLINE